MLKGPIGGIHVDTGDQQVITQGGDIDRLERFLVAAGLGVGVVDERRLITLTDAGEGLADLFTGLADLSRIQKSTLLGRLGRIDQQTSLAVGQEKVTRALFAPA